MSHGLITLPSNNSGTHSLGVCLARDKDFSRMDLSRFPSYLQQAPASPERCSLSSKTAGHGQLKGGLSQVPCTGIFFCWVTSLYIIQASSSASCCSSFSSSSKNAPSSDLGHLSRCENCSTHYVNSSKGSSGIPGGVFRPDAFGLLGFFSPFLQLSDP